VLCTPPVRQKDGTNRIFPLAMVTLMRGSVVISRAGAARLNVQRTVIGDVAVITIVATRRGRRRAPAAASRRT
jgi:hypothetical protein